MKYIDIRTKYLEYMQSKGHKVIPNSPLVPENDPSTLFTNSGMFPLVPNLLGEPHPFGNRLTNTQKCIRTGDIEDVGDETHLTHFEMFGNWSLNDYFKKEALEYTYEFFVKVLGIPKEKFFVTIFGGEGDVPEDTEAYNVWMDILTRYGIENPSSRIYKYGKDKNWWGLERGGPCGPCSEIFYDTGKPKCSERCHPNCDCGKFVEVGNNVLMQYNLVGGKLLPLGRHNIDFGGGLERLAMILQGVNSVWEIDLFNPIVDVVKELISTGERFDLGTGVQNADSDSRSIIIIVDHLKTSLLIIDEGVVPGRTEREYILRRLLRRAYAKMIKLNIDISKTDIILDTIRRQLSFLYPSLVENADNSNKVVFNEFSKFGNSIKESMMKVSKIANKYRNEVFTNQEGESFNLFESNGLPVEMFIEELENQGVKVDKVSTLERHNSDFQKHQDLSRTTAKGLFKGGLVGKNDTTTKYHTAQHLLLATMRKILGDYIVQKGSSITEERLRFDFPFDRKLTDEEILEIENLVNSYIEENLPVYSEVMKTEDALKIVTYAQFAERYGEESTVYYIGDKTNPISIEICGGPHVENTGKIGKFRIVKQESVGAGVRRIKGVIEAI